MADMDKLPTPPPSVIYLPIAALTEENDAYPPAAVEHLAKQLAVAADAAIMRFAKSLTPGLS